MVRTNSPAVCTTLKSKPRTRARRSLSRTSLDVKGSVVMEKVWVFEGMDDCKNGLTTEQLSDEDTGKDDWCEKHCWFLYTNLIAVQQCAKCSKRILTKRAAYKCTECKQLCHLKCAIKEEGNIKTDLRVSSTKASHESAMDFESFVKSDNIQTCRYTRKTSSHGQRARLKTREMCNTNNSIEEMETQDLVPEPSHQDIDLSKLSELHSTASSQSQTKQRLNSMKHGFVKRCRSFKNKVKTLKDKVNGENHKSSDDQTIPSSTSTTSSSTQNTADQESEQQKAWIRSPIRTRLREKQLEFRRESVRTKNRVRRNNSAKLRRLNNLQSENQAVSEEKSDWECHTDLALIKGRIDFIEKRVLDLETAIPQELHEWNRLKKKFEIDVHCKDTHNKDTLITGTHRDYVDETHPKHIEALQSGPLTHSASSGTTSDDVYIVPDHPSSSSHEDHHRGVTERHGADRATRSRQTKDPVMYSPVTSLHDDSLPSGIPHRFRLNMQNSQSSVYTEHQTSTPVTNKEISFRSASKQYESTHTVCHTAVTHVNMDHTYSDPSHNSTSEIKLQQHTSIEVEPSEKVLSPEQVAVKSFLDKRKSSSIGRRSTESGQCLEGRKSPSEFTSPRRSSIRSRSPYNLRSRNSLTKNEISPKIEANQVSFYSSPPIASSTFHENNRYGLSPTDMSSVLYSNKEVDDQDVSDYDEDIRLGTNDKNASSASNFSFTFRNDSQMIQTNADEDLPGYTRNYRPNRTTDVFQEELGDLMTEDNTDNNTDKDKVPYETDGLHSKPISHVTFASRESPTVTATTDDNLSLTNVKAFTGDLGNSFADSGCGVGRSRWINKDVRMFERDEQGNPIRPKISMSHDHIDERGDSGKPPIPRKTYSSHTEIDYLHEAEKRLDMYKTRRNVERSASMDSVEIKEHIAETQFVPETVSKLQHAVNNSPSPKGKQGPYNLRHGDLKTKSRTPSPRKGLDLRGSSSREPSPTNSYSDRSRSNSPGKSRRPYRDQETNQSEHSPHIINKLTSNIDSTTEFEEIERRLRNESQYRRSQSLTSLKQESSSGKKRQKSMSCTNSVDGETKSIINDSAMYHFLHDKGMIKISSPSLKIINGSSPACRRRYTPECNHIDEESSVMLHSGSESNLSGVIVNNEFHFNGMSRNISEGESRQTRSDFTQTGGESDTCEVRNYEDQEREMLEEYLRTTDENQAEWDNVLSWMNREHNTVSNEEVEQELEMLMEQQETEEYEQHNRTKQNSHQSPVSESLYYSFIGQSEELRGLLSPVRSSVQRNLSYQLEETFQVGPGLMYVITNGSIEDLKNYLNSDRTISESEIKEALKWALDQRNLKVAMLLLEDICKLIRGAEDEMCVDVFPAYLEQDRWQPVIVILTKQQYEGDWDLFMGLPVFRRRYDLVSNEARKVVYSEHVKSNPLNADDLKNVRRAIRSAKLDKHHSNVTVINGCPCRSRQGGQLLEKGLCIVVHCVVKGFIPFDEECFPSEIQGIPVDVREGYFLSGVATPTKSSQTADFVKTRQTETETDSHVSSDSAGSKCLTGSECDYMSEMTEHKQSVVTYKPTVFEDGDPGEINLAENNEELPAMNEELPVVNGQTVFSEDVIDKGLHCAGDNNQQSSHRDSLLMGSGITTLSIEGQGQATIQGQGTVGGFVHLADGGMGFITCAHVIGRCEDHSNITLQIHNPADQNKGDRKLSHKSIICGEVIKSVLESGTIDLSDNEEPGGHSETGEPGGHSETGEPGGHSETGEPGGHSETGVDAVVVKLTDPSRIQARFINITREQLQKTGYDDFSQPIFTDGQIMRLKDWRSEHLNDNVLKIGATTGLTQGYLYTEGCYLQHSPCVSRVYGSFLQHSPCVSRVYGSYLLNQLEIAAVDYNNKFFDCGDSGSLVFIRTDQTSLRCVGLAVGCTSYNTCIVTPIETVLHRLNLQQEFVKFEN